MTTLTDLSVDTRRWSLPDLGDFQCRWPLGDEPPYRFCGWPKAPHSRSYCGRHHALAYPSPQPRPRPAYEKAALVAIAAVAEAAAA